MDTSGYGKALRRWLPFTLLPAIGGWDPLTFHKQLKEGEG